MHIIHIACICFNWDSAGSQSRRTDNSLTNRPSLYIVHPSVVQQIDLSVVQNFSASGFCRLDALYACRSHFDDIGERFPHYCSLVSRLCSVRHIERNFVFFRYLCHRFPVLPASALPLNVSNRAFLRYGGKITKKKWQTQAFVPFSFWKVEFSEVPLTIKTSNLHIRFGESSFLHRCFHSLFPLCFLSVFLLIPPSFPPSFRLSAIYAQYMLNICPIYAQYMPNICWIYAHRIIWPFIRYAISIINYQLLMYAQYMLVPFFPCY